MIELFVLSFLELSPSQNHRAKYCVENVTLVRRHQAIRCPIWVKGDYYLKTVSSCL